MGRVAVDFGVGQGAKRSADIRSDLGQASNEGQRQNQRNPGGTRQKGSWPRRSLVAARCGDAPLSLLAIRPSASTRDPFQYFNSLLGRISVKTSSANNRCPEIRRDQADQWAEHREANCDGRN